ncbi:MAG: type II toxin-antitoxin system Phd/YefM family antitoxin [Verrucomicrobiales bacterium]|nr:type II toxin-antitoxin system Phd/YefM family antitoxin [Verrucomicrobiales bacterium]
MERATDSPPSALGFSPRPLTDNLRTIKTTPPEPEIVTCKGKPVSVIIPIKDYEERLERVEDAEDVAWLKPARKKPVGLSPAGRLSDYLATKAH